LRQAKPAPLGAGEARDHAGDDPENQDEEGGNEGPAYVGENPEGIEKDVHPPEVEATVKEGQKRDRGEQTRPRHQIHAEQAKQIQGDESDGPAQTHSAANEVLNQRGLTSIGIGGQLFQHQAAITLPLLRESGLDAALFDDFLFPGEDSFTSLFFGLTLLGGMILV
jgi:hypothetical protein